jgi:hypothetical protein
MKLDETELDTEIIFKAACQFRLAEKFLLDFILYASKIKSQEIIENASDLTVSKIYKESLKNLKSNLEKYKKEFKDRGVYEEMHKVDDESEDEVDRRLLAGGRLIYIIKALNLGLDLLRKGIETENGTLMREIENIGRRKDDAI